MARSRSCCNTLQDQGNTLQHATTRCNTLQHAATRCNTLQHAAIYLLSAPPHLRYLNERRMRGADHVATRCNTKETRFNTLHYAATRCTTLQHAATYLPSVPPHLRYLNVRQMKGADPSAPACHARQIHAAVSCPIQIYIYTFTYINVCTFAYVYIQIYMTSRCICMYTYANVHTFIYVNAYIYIHTHTRTHMLGTDPSALACCARLTRAAVSYRIQIYMIPR